MHETLYGIKEELLRKGLYESLQGPWPCNLRLTNVIGLLLRAKFTVILEQVSLHRVMTCFNNFFCRDLQLCLVIFLFKCCLRLLQVLTLIDCLFNCHLCRARIPLTLLLI